MDSSRTNVSAQVSQIRGLSVLAIDPGISGAMVYFNNQHKLVEWFRMPVVWRQVGKRRRRAIEPASLHAMLRGINAMWGINIAVIENVNPFGQGVTSAFAFGRSVGMVEGILGALDITAHQITPQKWKKHFRLIGSEKKDTVPLARTVFKGQLSEIKNSDTGIADAALIGLCLIQQGRST